MLYFSNIQASINSYLCSEIITCFCFFNSVLILHRLAYRVLTQNYLTVEKFVTGLYEVVYVLITPFEANAKISEYS